MEEHNINFLFFILLNSSVFHINSVYKTVDSLFIIISLPWSSLKWGPLFWDVSCAGINGSVFSKKQVTLFAMLINWQSIWCNIASYSVNKSKIAWKILIANQNFWIINQIDRRWKIGFQGKAIRQVLLARPHRIRRDVDSSEAERNFAEKKRVFWTFQQKVSKIPLQYQMVGGTRLELMTSAVWKQRSSQLS